MFDKVHEMFTTLLGEPFFTRVFQWFRFFSVSKINVILELIYLDKVYKDGHNIMFQKNVILREKKNIKFGFVALTL